MTLVKFLLILIFFRLLSNIELLNTSTASINCILMLSPTTSNAGGTLIIHGYSTDFFNLNIFETSELSDIESISIQGINNITLHENAVLSTKDGNIHIIDHAFENMILKRNNSSLPNNSSP